MTETTHVKSRRGPVAGAALRGSRRLVAFERHYTCDSCGAERNSWKRLAACPECGDAFVAAVIRRAAVS